MKLLLLTPLIVAVAACGGDTTSLSDSDLDTLNRLAEREQATHSPTPSTTPTSTPTSVPQASATPVSDATSTPVSVPASTSTPVPTSTSTPDPLIPDTDAYLNWWDTQQDLWTQNYAQWTAEGPSNYLYFYEQIYMGSAGPRAGHWVYIENNEVVDILHQQSLGFVVNSREHLDPSNVSNIGTNLGTIETIFDNLSNKMDDHPFDFDATYTAEYGVPSRINIDDDGTIIDDEEVLRLNNFIVIDPTKGGYGVNDGYHFTDWLLDEWAEWFEHKNLAITNKIDSYTYEANVTGAWYFTRHRVKVINGEIESVYDLIEEAYLDSTHFDDFYTLAELFDFAEQQLVNQPAQLEITYDNYLHFPNQISIDRYSAPVDGDISYSFENVQPFLTPIPTTEPSTVPSTQPTQTPISTPSSEPTPIPTPTGAIDEPTWWSEQNDNWQDNQSLWQAMQPELYVYRVEHIEFGNELPAVGHWVLANNEGIIDALHLSSQYGEHVTADQFDSVDTIDAVFDFIYAEMHQQQKPDDVRVLYDVDLGYPTYSVIDYNAALFDEEEVRDIRYFSELDSSDLDSDLEDEYNFSNWLLDELSEYYQQVRYSHWSNLDNYQYTYVYNSSLLYSEYEVVVENDQVVSVFATRTQEYLEEEEFVNFYTVEDMYRIASDAIFRLPKTLEINYNSQYHFPEEIIINQIEFPIDGGVYFSFKNLQLIENE